MPKSTSIQIQIILFYINLENLPQYKEKAMIQK